MQPTFIQGQLYFNTGDNRLYRCESSPCFSEQVRLGFFDVRMRVVGCGSSDATTFAIGVYKFDFIHVRIANAPKEGDKVIILSPDDFTLHVSQSGRAQRFGASAGTTATVMKCNIKLKGNKPMQMLKFDSRYVYNGQKKTYNTDNYWVDERSFVIVETADSTLSLDKSDWNNVKVSSQAEAILNDMFDTPAIQSTTPYKIVAHSTYGALGDTLFKTTVDAYSKSFENLELEPIEDPIKVNKKKAILLL